MKEYADYNLARNKVKLPGLIPETERELQLKENMQRTEKAQSK